MKLTKKGRVKNLPVENGIHDIKEKQDKREVKRRRKKSNDAVTEEITSNVNKKNKKGKNNFIEKQTEKDLTNFINITNFNEPRLKRKCVLQNEAKSKDWWSDDEEEDDDDEEENVTNGKEESEKKVDDNSNADIKQDSDNDFKTDEKPTKRRRKRNVKLQKQEKVLEPSAPIQVSTHTETVRCYVFSTGMANRAGHAVTNGTYKSISAYHHDQKWDTPYLNAEIHCRKFYPELEEQTNNMNSGFDIAIKDIIVKQDENDPPVSVKENTATENEPVESLPEKTSDQSDFDMSQEYNPPVQENLTIEHNNKGEELTQSKGYNYSTDENVKSPLHPRFNLMANKKEPNLNSSKEEYEKQISNEKDDKNLTQEVKLEPKIEITEPLPVSGNETDSPVIFEPDSESRVSVTKSNTYPAEVTKTTKDQIRFQSNDSSTYQAPKEQKQSENNGTRHQSPNNTRPSVLNMVTDRKSDNEVLRSAIDIAEKELRESRVTQLQPTPSAPPNLTHNKSTVGPVIPRDVHPSVFMSRHSPHLHVSAFTAPQQSGISPAHTNGLPSHSKSPHVLNGHVPHSSGPIIANGSIFSSRHQNSLSGPFTPPPPRSSTSQSHYHSTVSSHHPELHSKYSPSMPICHPYTRHKSDSPPNSYKSVEIKYGERYNPLSSNLHKPHERPSSLPVPSTHRLEPTKVSEPNRRGNKSFSVESLTQPSNKSDTFNSIHPHLDKLHGRLLPSRTIGERSVLPEHLMDRIPANLRAPNGLDFREGIKRSLNERLSSEIRSSNDIRIPDKAYLEKLQEHRLLEHDRFKEHLIDKDRYHIEKERYITEKDRFQSEKERFMAMDKERLFEKERERGFFPHSRIPFPHSVPTDSRGLMIPTPYMSRAGLSNGSPLLNEGQTHNFSSSGAYSQLHRMGIHPFPAPPFTKR